MADPTLIVGIGSFTPQMAELPASEVRRRQVWVDDLDGARHEAGDLLQAGIDWSRVHSLAEALRHSRSDSPAAFVQDRRSCRLGPGRRARRAATQARDTGLGADFSPGTARAAARIHLLIAPFVFKFPEIFSKTSCAAQKTGAIVEGLRRFSSAG